MQNKKTAADIFIKWDILDSINRNAIRRKPSIKIEFDKNGKHYITTRGSNEKR